MVYYRSLVTLIFPKQKRNLRMRFGLLPSATRAQNKLRIVQGEQPPVHSFEMVVDPRKCILVNVLKTFKQVRYIHYVTRISDAQNPSELSL